MPTLPYQVPVVTAHVEQSGEKIPPSLVPMSFRSQHGIQLARSSWWCSGAGQLGKDAHRARFPRPCSRMVPTRMMCESTTLTTAYGRWFTRPVREVEMHGVWLASSGRSFLDAARDRGRELFERQSNPRASRFQTSQLVCIVLQGSGLIRERSRYLSRRITMHNIHVAVNVVVVSCQATCGEIVPSLRRESRAGRVQRQASTSPRLPPALPPFSLHCLLMYD